MARKQRPPNSGPSGRRKPGAISSFQAQKEKLQELEKDKNKAERKVRKLQKELEKEKEEKKTEKAWRQRLEIQLGVELERQQDAISAGVRARLGAVGLSSPF